MRLPARADIQTGSGRTGTAFHWTYQFHHTLRHRIRIVGFPHLGHACILLFLSDGLD
jgi:hypothetical protein